MTQERNISTQSGWTMLAVVVVTLIGIALLTWAGIQLAEGTGQVIILSFAGVLLIAWCIILNGFFTLQPNMSAVMLLFGEYRGTAKQSGFRFTNPLYTKTKVSLRAHNLNGDKLKVNDSRGNPVEIAAVVVWRVRDTAQAVFDVENYKDYVHIQSESAVRHLASRYPYDTGEQEELSLRGSIDEVSLALQEELAERLIKAGVIVDEARIAHLAYAQEIAGAMLRRQQAEAVVAARTRIVDGAVGMVEMALRKLEQETNIPLDDDRKAAMISNLLVVLCAEREAQPVVNTGTLYH